MTNRQQRDAIHIEVGELAEACERITNLRERLDKDEVHYSIIRALDEANTKVSDACNALNYAESLLRNVAENKPIPARQHE